MMCGNGSVRTPHPVELFGDDWNEWGRVADEGSTGPQQHTTDERT
jgi:hypothetical protein